MKKYLQYLSFIVAAVFAASTITAQVVLMDDFDSYIADDYVASQSGGVWTTWGDAPGTSEDAYVSTDQAYSGSNSVLLEAGLGTDLVLPFAPDSLASGVYRVGMKAYFPAGSGGYFNLMHQFDFMGNYEWAIDVFFSGDGTGTVTAGGVSTTAFTYTEDEWIDVAVAIDLDKDWARLVVGFQAVYEWQWSLIGGSGLPGQNTLDVMDIYPDAVAGAHFYIDDVYMSITNSCRPASVCDDFDTYTVGGYVAEQAPGLWTTWGGNPGTGEDGVISDAQAASGANSLEMTAGLGQDLVLPLGNYTDGASRTGMKMYMPAGSGGYFNIMHEFDFAGNYEWVIDVFFNGDGTGTVTAGGVNTTAFTYPEDEWFDVAIVSDMAADKGRFTVGFKSVFEWQWSLIGNTGAAGINQLGVIDIYPDAVAGAHFYIDDIYMQRVPSCQHARICDNFDSYNAGEFVGPQAGGLWTTWSNASGTAEDGVVSDVQSASGPNSLEMTAGLGQDLVLPLGNYTDGSSRTGMNMYFPAGSGGYFNIMHNFTYAGGWEWAIDVFFNGDGTGTVTAGGVSTTTFTYPEDEWFPLAVVSDMDADQGRFTVGLDEIFRWQWSLIGNTGAAGINQLGVIDIYPDAVAGAHFFVDDIYMERVTSCNGGILCDNFDQYESGDYVAAQSNGLWTTWGNSPGTGEDALVSDAQSFSGANSIELVDGGTDLVLPLGNNTTGGFDATMKMYFPAGSGGYFNIMHNFTYAGGWEWAIDVFFNGDGTGMITAGGVSTTAFTYSEDTWIDVSVIADLDDDLAAVTIEGTEAFAWQWSLIGGSGAAGMNKLSVIDFYPAAVAGAHFFVDDVALNDGNIVGIEEFKSNNDLVVYPNPTEGLINITAPEGSLVGANISVYNNVGQLLLQTIGNNSNTEVIDLSSVNAGLYHVVVRGENFTATKKVSVK